MMEDVRRNRASANLSVKSSALESTYLRNSAGSAYSSCSKDSDAYVIRAIG